MFRVVFRAVWAGLRTLAFGAIGAALSLLISPLFGLDVLWTGKAIPILADTLCLVALLAALVTALSLLPHALNKWRR